MDAITIPNFLERSSALVGKNFDGLFVWGGMHGPPPEPFGDKLLAVRHDKAFDAVVYTLGEIDLHIDAESYTEGGIRSQYEVSIEHPAEYQVHRGSMCDIIIIEQASAVSITRNGHDPFTQIRGNPFDDTAFMLLTSWSGPLRLCLENLGKNISRVLRAAKLDAAAKVDLEAGQTVMLESMESHEAVAMRRRLKRLGAAVTILPV
jgi:hypothetical protein